MFPGSPFLVQKFIKVFVSAAVDRRNIGSSENHGHRSSSWTVQDTMLGGKQGQVRGLDHLTGNLCKENGVDKTIA